MAQLSAVCTGNFCLLSFIGAAFPRLIGRGDPPWRSFSFFRPANTILVPGMYFLGLSRYSNSVSSPLQNTKQKEVKNRWWEGSSETSRDSERAIDGEQGRDERQKSRMARE